MDIFIILLETMTAFSFKKFIALFRNDSHKDTSNLLSHSDTKFNFHIQKFYIPYFTTHDFFTYSRQVCNNCINVNFSKASCQENTKIKHFK